MSKKSQLLLVSVLYLFESASTFAQQRISSPGHYAGYSQTLYSEWVRTSQYITVRDGTRLAADIYRPAVKGKAVAQAHPVIWQHTFTRTRSRTGTVVPGSVFAMVKELTKYGYVVVEVDRRGMGASFGARRGYLDRTEARDAFDVTEWLAAQSWSDGNIGVYGCSNTGAAAMQVPTFMPPHLKAVFAGCYAWDTYDGFLRGGIFANWGAGPERTIEQDLRQNAPVDGSDGAALLQQAVNEHRANTGIAAMWKGMPWRDSWSDLVGSRFWLEASVSTYRDQIQRSGVAIYTQGGWYDDFRRGGLLAFANLSNRDKIVIGPWQHCRNDGFDLFAEYRRFFDATLKQIDNGIFDEPPIRYFTINAPAGEEWRSAQQWPPQATQTQYFLQAGAAPRALAASMPPGVPPGLMTRESKAADVAKTLVAKNSVAKDDFTVRYDVSCPANWPQLTQTCLLDDKGITYTSGALTESTEVTGHPLVTLWLASTAADGNVFAYLEDVAPDGAATIVTDGRLRLSLRALNQAPYGNFDLPWHRSLESDAVAMPLGQPVETVFDMLPVSYVFRAGHRIRLTVTGADPRERLRVVPEVATVLSIYTDSEHPSALTLPIVTAGK